MPATWTILGQTDYAQATLWVLEDNERARHFYEAAGWRVASLAVMSTDYYTRLEQRRGPQPSEHMLASLARALRLTGDERTYLYRIAGHNAPVSLSASPHVAPALLRVLDRLDDTPALVLTDLGETLVQNRMAAALFGDASRHTGLARSAIHRWFTDPAERSIHPEADHDRQSRAQVASLRAAHGLRGPRSRAGELVRALQKANEEFAELGNRHEVAQRFEDHKTPIHPELGVIELDCQALFTEDRSQTLLVLTAPPRTGATRSCNCSPCSAWAASPKRSAGVGAGGRYRRGPASGPPRTPAGRRRPHRGAGPPGHAVRRAPEGLDDSGEQSEQPQRAAGAEEQQRAAAQDVDARADDQVGPHP